MNVMVAVAMATLFFASSPAPSATPSVSPTPSSTGPIQVIKCGPPGATLHGLRAKIWRVDYINQTNKIITEADFTVFDKDFRVATLTDHGQFSPHIEINHPIPSSDIIKEGDATICVPSRAVFADGTTWNSGLPGEATVIAAQPDSPVEINSCGYGYTNPGQGDYDFDIAVSFTNIGKVGATAVRFKFVGFDAFDSPIESWSGTILGQFSPDVLIEPGYNVDASTPAGPQPGNAAWRFLSVRATDVVRIECSVDAVRFADDSKWIHSSEKTHP